MAADTKMRDAVEQTGLELRRIYELVDQGEVDAVRDGAELLVDIEQLKRLAV